MAPASKRKKAAKKSTAKSRSPKRTIAKRPQKAAKRGAGSSESADHYSDIRRSMQAAILRTMR